MDIEILKIKAFTGSRLAVRANRKFAYEVGAGGQLINGRNVKLTQGESLPDGLVEAPPDLDKKKRWAIVGGNFVEYFPSPESAEVQARLKSRELDRLEGGRDATAEIAVEMKGDDAALNILTDQQFEALNQAGEPVSSALLKGQFQTALSRWRQIFSADSTAAVELRPTISAFVSTQLFSDLNAAVVAIIKAKIKEWDGLTDEQLAAL